MRKSNRSRIEALETKVDPSHKVRVYFTSNSTANNGKVRPSQIEKMMIGWNPIEFSRSKIEEVAKNVDSGVSTQRYWPATL